MQTKFEDWSRIEHCGIRVATVAFVTTTISSDKTRTHAAPGIRKSRLSAEPVVSRISRVNLRSKRPYSGIGLTEEMATRYPTTADK